MRLPTPILRNLLQAALLAALVLPQAAAAQGGEMALAISSNDFPNGGDIARKFTCDGADISPELSWTSAPPNTQSFALIADDPDAPAGTWTHWVIYNLPGNSASLAQNVAKVDQLPDGASRQDLENAMQGHVLGQAELMGRYQR